MFFKTHGKGDNLVVAIHGWMSDSNQFNSVAEHLPEGSRLVALDLPGFGKSATPSYWDIRDIGHDIAQTVNQQDYNNLSLLTNCSGAYPALHAIEHIEFKPTQLVMVDSFAYMPRYFRVFTNRTWGHHAYRSTFANPIGRLMTDIALRKQAGNRSITNDFRRGSHDNALAWLRACNDLGNCSQFSNISLPTLIVWGKQSFGAVRRSVSKWREIWPHAETLELQGAGHNLIEACASEIAEIVFSGITIKGV
ncbi:MAG: alpha/beta fold hydrolase [Planctomycetota bacterium]|jgi:pimeloyl-ACP methyl ester carboxylesterase